MARIATTKAEAVRLSSYSRSSVYRWLRTGAPQLPDGTWDMDAVEAWAEEEKSRKAQASVNARPDRQGDDDPPGGAEAGDGEPDDAGQTQMGPLSAARLAELEVKTEERRFKLEQQRGLFVLKADVEQMLTDRMAALRRRLLAVARQVGVEIAQQTGADPLDAEDVVNAALTEVLREVYGQRR